MKQSIPQFYTRPGLHVEIYDAQTKAGWQSIHDDVSFYLEEARALQGPILELACGTGRILMPLAQIGRETHGLDANSAMLEAARQKLASLSSKQAALVHLHQGSMADFDLARQFGLVLIGFRSFQAMLTPEDQRRCLTCIRKHLTADGRAILNLFDPRYDFMLPGWQESFQSPREMTNPASGHQVLVETLQRYNEPLTQTFTEKWRFTEKSDDGSILRQEEEELRLRWTFRQEMRHLAEICGLTIEHEYSDFHRSPPAYGQEQIWVLKRS